jgi:hypothetical protein
MGFALEARRLLAQVKGGSVLGWKDQRLRNLLLIGICRIRQQLIARWLPAANPQQRKPRRGAPTGAPLLAMTLSNEPAYLFRRLRHIHDSIWRRQLIAQELGQKA